MNFDSSELADARLELLGALVRAGEDVKKKSHEAWERSNESVEISDRSLSNLKVQQANILRKLKDLEEALAPARGQKAKALLAEKKDLKDSLAKVSKQLEDETKRNVGHAKHQMMWMTLATTI